jgi:tetratricopeptide (TPR) repeat protein
LRHVKPKAGNSPSREPSNDLSRNSTGGTPGGPEKAAAQSIRASFLLDARARLPDYDGALRRGGAESHSLPWLRLQTRLLLAEEHTDAAAAAIDTFAKTQSERIESATDVDKNAEAEKSQARLYLGIGNLYSSIGRHASAEAWYRKLMSVAPNTYALLVQSLANQGKLQEAIQVCLETGGAEPSADTATIMARLLTVAEANKVELDDVQPTISTALETHGDNVELLMSVAVFHASRGNSAESIRLFRRVVELAPKHVLALNNLATLLSEEPGHEAEALAMIERAITIAGRQSGLLDTQGTIYLQTGDPAKAVTCLEESVVADAADPRYYFHLAAAYQAAGQNPEAETALNQARSRGLSKSILTDGDQKLLTKLEQQFPAEVREN